MTKDNGGDINPAYLSDIYVDMCPTTWATQQGSGDARLIERLRISAAHHGFTSELNTWKQNGQDH